MANDESLIQSTKEDIAKFFNRECNEEDEAEVSETEMIEESSKCSLRLCLMSAIMAFSRLCGVSQYSYYLLDIMKHARVTIKPSWASAGVSIFEMIGTY